MSHKSPSAELLLRDSSAFQQRQALLGNHSPSNHSRASSAPPPGAGLRRDLDGDDEDLQELQQQALGTSQETTSAIQSCLRVAEDMRHEATQTIVQLHEQGQQIRRTHESALVLEQELNKGEKLLASLGGIFSRPWRPKRGQELSGPLDFHHDNPVHAAAHPDRKEFFEGNGVAPKSSSSPPQQASTFQSHVQDERAKQDEALSSLSSVLDQLKEMSSTMGDELGRQNESLGRLHGDVSELEFRVKNANQREHQLLHQ
ncbi:SNAP25 homologous protein SNAP33 [Selaginella moellendorffii]|uniref:SNAP25 homologous protein SNAP33 n=1 Tax=Selaginella moellendorffii TaxID=88036 RepID=UPI000D1D005C|nr:SNAP25 homologous protein SNAP33 [Selaginella moellendorffii]|eukprot:XP_024545149.1 SNAP25 homologous protein SNAP33 [Selaginella moellendorffii]